jgi:Exopolysaccharide biosynthesis protein YbjH
LASLWLCVAGSAQAESLVEPAPQAGTTASDYGGIGLLQVPSARIGADGDVSVNASFVEPYQRYMISGVGLPWLEGTFRETKIINRPFGPVGFGSTESYLDRALDLKLRLEAENLLAPEVSVGIRDVVGTGLFGAEYLVATKRFEDFDVTVGLGWGELASSAMLPNPFRIFGSHFDTRQGNGAIPNSTAGAFRSDYFAGRNIGIFGGVEYQTPLDGLSVKLEFDSDDYRQDPLGELAAIKPRGPIDLGLVYRPWSWLEASAAMERENTVMLRFGVRGNLATPGGAAYHDPDATPRLMAVPAPIPSEAPAPIPVEQRHELSDLAFSAERLGFRVLSVSTAGGARQANAAWLGTAPVPSEDIGQLARAVARVAPAVTDVDLQVDAAGLERRYRLSAPALEQAVAVTGRTAELIDRATATAPQQAMPARDKTALDRDLAQAVFADLAKIGFTGESFEIRHGEAILRFSQPSYRSVPRALGEAARIVLAHAPSDVRSLTFGVVEDGVETLRITLLRRDLEAALSGEGSAAEILSHASLSGGGEADPDAIANDQAYPDFTYRLRPRLKEQLNGPNGFFLYDLYAGLSTEMALRPGLSLTGEFGASLVSNFDELTLPSNSVLPHVRSDIADYLRDGRYGVDRFQLDQISQLGPDLYGRVSGGLLEEMFGGVDGEVLYRPYGARWAVGLDVNHVWQRGYHELFSFRPYDVTTALATVYDQLPWYGLTAKISFGRYLAGDRGVTFDLSRQFDSGIRIGAFATATNDDGARFGEGSFDKGFYFSIPLDSVLPFATKSIFDLTYRPVTRDGGQALSISKPLYDVTQGTDPETAGRQWSEIRD